jgi:hypothetical protein
MSGRALLFALAYVICGSSLGASEPSEKPSLTSDNSGADVPVAIASDAIRASVTRGLPFLEEAGVAWMNERGCLSCHHIPFLLWTHHSAHARGLTVHLDKLSEWERWARKDSLSHRNGYKLSKAKFDAVETTSIPEAVRQKLSPIVDQLFADEQAFSTKLSELLSEEELNANQSVIREQAELPLYSADRSGGGLDVLGQLVLSRQGVAADPDANEFRDGLFSMIERLQLPQGAWTPGIQFATMRRWTKAAADQETTMWAVIALLEGTTEDTLSPHVRAAREYLAGQPSQTDNVEWLSTRVLLDHRLGDTISEAVMREKLVTAQKSDGGWSWELPGPSDPYTTGLVLYVLGKTQALVSSERIVRGQRYLVSSQQADGSWLTPARNISNTTVPERLQARDEIYHYWGTAWAVLGLLETMPAKR